MTDAAPQHLLLVDDEAAFRDVIAERLAEQGFQVAQAGTGEDAVARLSEFAFDILITDLRLPGVDGRQVLDEAFSRYPDIIAIVITGFGTVREAVEVTRLGAEGFITKPFQFEELIARLTAALRRPQLIEDVTLRWRDLSVNLETHEVFRNERPIELTQREFELLAVFMREPRRVFSKDHLLELVWGHDFEGGTNIVETYISYLRNKLDTGGENSILRTVRGVGYGLA